MSISKFISKVIGEKRRWRQYKARIDSFPRATARRSTRWSGTSCTSGATDGDSAAAMFEDLADLFEQSAADGTPIREIVGDDPVEFVEAFVQNYPKGSGSTGSGNG